MAMQRPTTFYFVHFSFPCSKLATVPYFSALLRNNYLSVHLAYSIIHAANWLLKAATFSCANTEQLVYQDILGTLNANHLPTADTYVHQPVIQACPMSQQPKPSLCDGTHTNTHTVRVPLTLNSFGSSQGITSGKKYGVTVAHQPQNLHTTKSASRCTAHQASTCTLLNPCSRASQHFLGGLTPRCVSPSKRLKV